MIGINKLLAVKIFHAFGNAPTKAVLLLIIFYQKTLSPDHGLGRAKYPRGFCRFKPTCSEYSFEAIKKYGLARGGTKAVWRVLRCNPWSRGGWDPVE